MSGNEDLIEVREAHRFDREALERYLAARVPGFSGPVRVRQFEGGQSNPTFMLETPERRYVMRKKPPGKLLKSAHMVDREYRVIEALAETDVPVPRVHCLCQDEGVIGTSFYVMEYVEGRVIRRPDLPGASREERSAIYDSMNEVLASLHSVDFEAVGLSDFGKPGNYFERQIGRWTAQYRAAQTEELTDMEDLTRWLPENIPADDSVSIVHGDFRLENSIFPATGTRMLALLDWELSTIGHPLADLAYNCMIYHFPTTADTDLVDVDCEATGIPTEEAYVKAYCRRTGRTAIQNWNFYLAFSFFRLASISQGVYKRGLDGIASSARALEFEDKCRLLAAAACSILGGR